MWEDGMRRKSYRSVFQQRWFEQVRFTVTTTFEGFHSSQSWESLSR